MSRCCVGAATCPAAFLGTLPTINACAELARAAARHHERDIMLIPAGAVINEYKLVLEDYVAAGGLIERMIALTGAEATGDAARMARDAFGAALARGLEQTFRQTDNGHDLCGMGFEADVRFASQVNVLTEVPMVVRTEELPSGGVGAVLSLGR